MIVNWNLIFNIDPIGVAIATIIVAAALITARIIIYISEHEYLATEKNITIACYILGSILVGFWLYMQFGINPVKLTVLSTEMLSNLEGAKTLTQVGAEMLFMYPIIMHFLMKSQWFLKFCGLDSKASDVTEKKVQE
jgi:hypothetical protein